MQHGTWQSFGGIIRVMILYRVVLTEDDGWLGVVLYWDSFTSRLTINCLNANYRKKQNIFLCFLVVSCFEMSQNIWLFWDTGVRYYKITGLVRHLPGISGYDQTCVLVYCCSTHSAHDLNCRRTILVGRVGHQSREIEVISEIWNHRIDESYHVFRDKFLHNLAISNVTIVLLIVIPGKS